MQAAVVVHRQVVGQAGEQRRHALFVLAQPEIAEARREHHRVDLAERRPLAGIDLAQVDRHMGAVVPGGHDLAQAEHVDPVLVAQTVFVERQVQFADHIAVDRRIVRVMQVAVQLPLRVLRDPVVVVDELGEVDVLAELARILEPVAVAAHDVADPRLRIFRAQMHHDLRRALAAAEHGDVPDLARLLELLQPRRQFGQMEGARVRQRLERLRNERRAPGRHHDAARRIALAIRRFDAVAAVAGQPAELRHRRVVAHAIGEEPRRPRHVLRILDAQRKLDPQVEMLEEPTVLEQEVHEGVAAARVARRHQVPARVVLDIGARQQHFRLPLRRRPPLEEQARSGETRLLERNGKRQVGRTESDPDYVIGFAHID